MPRAKSAHRPPPPRVAPDLDWIVSTTFEANGRHIEPGTELSITREPGARFRFVRHVRRPDGREWIDVIGGPKGVQAFRSFRPDRIRTVHRINRTRANAS